MQHLKWPSPLKLSDGLQIKHCYWTLTTAKQTFIHFGSQNEFDVKTAGFLFRLIELNC